MVVWDRLQPLCSPAWKKHRVLDTVDGCNRVATHIKGSEITLKKLGISRNNFLTSGTKQVYAVLKSFLGAEVGTDRQADDFDGRGFSENGWPSAFSTTDGLDKLEQGCEEKQPRLTLSKPHCMVHFNWE